MQKKRIFTALLSMALIFTMLPAALAGNGYESYMVARNLRDQASTNNNRWVDVPGRGKTLFYAQTNPFWAKMRYEMGGSTTFRRFGEGGCCPTSIAMAIANLLPIEELGKIRPYASGKTSGYGISTGIMNPLNMQGRDGVYWINTAEDYLKYLPLVFGQYACGNNVKRSSWRAKPREEGISAGGTGAGFLTELCAIYGLTYTKMPNKGNLDWMEPVKNGAIAVALANSQFQPFSSGPGHYVAIVGCDDEYLYIMDPQDKTQEGYKNDDRRGVLEVMESGFVRVRHENFNNLHIGMVHVVSNADVDARLAKSQASSTGEAQAAR